MSSLSISIKKIMILKYIRVVAVLRIAHSDCPWFMPDKYFKAKIKSKITSEKNHLLSTFISAQIFDHAPALLKVFLNCECRGFHSTLLSWTFEMRTDSWARLNFVFVLFSFFNFLPSIAALWFIKWQLHKNGRQNEEMIWIKTDIYRYEPVGIWTCSTFLPFGTCNCFYLYCTQYILNQKSSELIRICFVSWFSAWLWMWLVPLVEVACQKKKKLTAGRKSVASSVLRFYYFQLYLGTKSKNAVAPETFF